MALPQKPSRRGAGASTPARRVPPRRSGWRHAPTYMVLPLPVVQTMFRRARAWSVVEGGRFDPRSSAVLLWTGAGREAPSRVVGAFSVRWHQPVHGFAAINLVAWNEPRGGSLAEMCRAIELLAGVAWQDAPGP